jgi:hypothetical protein
MTLLLRAFHRGPDSEHYGDYGLYCIFSRAYMVATAVKITMYNVVMQRVIEWLSAVMRCTRCNSSSHS